MCVTGNPRLTSPHRVPFLYPVHQAPSSGLPTWPQGGVGFLCHPGTFWPGMSSEFSEQLKERRTLIIVKDIVSTQWKETHFVLFKKEKKTETILKRNPFIPAPFLSFHLFQHKKRVPVCLREILARLGKSDSPARTLNIIRNKDRIYQAWEEGASASCRIFVRPGCAAQATSPAPRAPRRELVPRTLRQTDACPELDEGDGRGRCLENHPQCRPFCKTIFILKSVFK